MKKKVRVIRNAEGEVVATYQLGHPESESIQPEVELEKGEDVEEMEVSEDYIRDPDAFHKRHKKVKPPP
jgi:hypothetical protein